MAQQAESLFHHIALVRLHEGVDEATQAEVVRRLEDIGQNQPGLVSWFIHLSLDTRKGTIIAEEGIFEDHAAFERFRDSDQHHELGEFMKTVADWWIADYQE